MTHKTVSLTQQDIEQFQQAVQDVNRYHCQKITPYRQRIRPLPIQHEQNEIAHSNHIGTLSPQTPVITEHTHAFFHRGGLPKRLLRQLRRGKIPIQDSIDLHGYTLSQAQAQLHFFLQRCLNANLYCVRIIHGRGLHSPAHLSIVKIMVNQWLTQTQDIVAFHGENASHHHDFGAVCVLLKPCYNHTT